MASGKRWTELEIEQAIALYFVTPFGRLHQNNPHVVELAKRLGRTSGSVALKLVNLASIDETLDRKGMSNFSRLDKRVWDRVFNQMLLSASNISEDNSFTSEISVGFSENQQAIFNSNATIGIDVFTITTARQGQRQFRKIISANYDYSCAVSGISQQELLIAGHISPWSKDKKNRLNPSNGILLNRLHEKAFDDGLISFDDNGGILYSDRLKPETRNKLKEIEIDGYLREPSKFKPDMKLIRTHRKTHLGI